MAITPRPYQSLAVKAALKGLRGRQKRALVVLATGLGKTFTAAFVTKAFRPKRALFIVHNNHILKHAVDEFRQVFNERTKMAIFNGMSKNGAHEADMVFATWQTMNGNLKSWKRNHFDLVIVDEAHHTEASTYRPVVDYFVGARLGITATPDRADEADIRVVFGPEVINITLEEAIARGWLPRVEYHVVTDESLDEDALQTIAMEIREGKKRFTMAEVNRRIFIRKREKEIARIIDGYNEKSVVFCANIKHAERMTNSLKLSATFHSEVAGTQKATWDQNQETLKALKNGTIRRVCAVNAFNEGVNVPSVGLVAFCRVTGSLTIFRQQLGRGLRPGKDKLIVLDFVGNLERIQLVLQMMNKISDLHEHYTDQRERDREGYERSNFEVSGRGFEFTFSDRVVDLMKVLEHCEAEFYPTWQEAMEAVCRLKIRNQQQYVRTYKADSHLPSNPDQHYSDFPGWRFFLGRDYSYINWQQASIALQRLGIKSYEEYTKRYKEDLRLPSAPKRRYDNFPGWVKFLGKSEKYSSWQQASRAAVCLKISSVRDYKQKSRKDSQLPKDPYSYYPNFPGWKVFLGKKIHCLTWRDASKVAIAMGIKDQTEYFKRYGEDKRLPSSPHTKYKDFPGYRKFLRKK